MRTTETTYAGPHERRFALYLELAHAGPAETKRILETRIPRELSAYDAKGNIVPVRELLKSEAIDGTTLIQTEFYNTIIEGASLAKAMRTAVPKVTMTSNKVTIPFRKSAGYMKEVPEAAEAPIDESEIINRDIAAKTYRERSLITQNMVDDCQYDLIAEEAKHHGERAENTLNHIILGVMLQGSELEHDSEGSNQGTKSVATAKGKVRAKGYIPDTLVMCPDAETLIGKEYLVTSNTGSQQAILGQLPPMLGLKPHTVGTTTSSSTYTWGYAADSNIGMIVYDSRVAAKYGLRQDIMLENYRDPVRDLNGAVVKLRFGAVVGLGDAICRVEY